MTESHPHLPETLDAAARAGMTPEWYLWEQERLVFLEGKATSILHWLLLLTFPGYPNDVRCEAYDLIQELRATHPINLRSLLSIRAPQCP